MALDRDKLERIVEATFSYQILDAYGAMGTETVRRLMKIIRRIYDHLAPELINDKLIIVEPLDERRNLEDELPNASQKLDYQYLAQEYQAKLSGSSLLIQVNQDKVHIWLVESDYNYSNLSENALVYIYERGLEAFLVKGKEQSVLNPDPVYPSVFSIPTFNALEAALEEYEHLKVRTSGCKIFSSAWYDEKERLFFKPGPEATMRDSLTQHLKTVLKGAEVRPEQNVDESHPVDIKITWMSSNRIAIIEIKWLGNSLNERNNFIEYRDARANEGARQLADYLEANKTQAPIHQTKGYLVIIDGRRRGLRIDTQSIDVTNGYYYQTKELEFTPPYHEIRSDFAKPLRMFAEPVCR